MWFLRRGHMWFLYRYFFSLASFGIFYLSLIFCSLKMRCVLSCFSHVWLFATPWTIPHQSPLSMEFSRQEYWNRLPFPSPGDLPNPGMDLIFLMSPALVGGFFTTSTTWEALKMTCPGTIFFFFLSFISLVLNSGGRIVLLSKRFPILHLFIPPPPLKLLAATEFVRCYGFFLLFSLSPQFYFFLNYL